MVFQGLLKAAGKLRWLFNVNPRLTVLWWDMSSRLTVCWWDMNLSVLDVLRVYASINKPAVLCPLPPFPRGPLPGLDQLCFCSLYM